MTVPQADLHAIAIINPMTIAFTKMHGAGNDYIYVDGFTQMLPADLSVHVAAMCERHTGIGADGVILITPSTVADARMQMWNADGSVGEMCGNGLRCVAKYLFDRNMTTGPEFAVETGAGVKTVWVTSQNGTAETVRVSMGAPIFDAEDIPTLLPGDPPLNVRIKVDSRQFWVTCLSMGNPHCVIFVDEPDDEWVLRLGPQLERNSKFPNRTNVEFVQVVSRDKIRLRVWERGSGETLACGTGASAAVVASVLLNKTNRQVVCELPGGILEVDWDIADNQVYLTGPAVEVYDGAWPLDETD